MAWKIGFSWTEGHWENTTNPDNTVSTMYVHGGLFFWLPLQITNTMRIETYIGFRPTPTWSIGYGNEGDGKFFTRIGQWMKRKGWGNFGIALRIKKKWQAD